MMKTLTKEEALHCANVFTNYFGQFNRIDQYMRDQKMAQIETIPSPLPGMGLDSDIDPIMLKATNLKNDQVRKNRDWEKQEGRAVINK